MLSDGFQEVKFVDLFDAPRCAAVDRHFESKGWKLVEKKHDTGVGYQVFFGKGVQIDNFFEFAFPHLLEKEWIVASAEDFLESHGLLEKDSQNAAKSGIKEIAENRKDRVEDQKSCGRGESEREV